MGVETRKFQLYILKTHRDVFLLAHFHYKSPKFSVAWLRSLGLSKFRRYVQMAKLRNSMKLYQRYDFQELIIIKE